MIIGRFTLNENTKRIFVENRSILSKLRIGFEVFVSSITLQLYQSTSTMKTIFQSI